MQLRPFHYDEERADVRAAMVALSIWNVQIAKSSKNPVFRKIREFLMGWGDSDIIELFGDRRQTERDRWDDLKRYAEAVGRSE